MTADLLGGSYNQVRCYPRSGPQPRKVQHVHSSESRHRSVTLATPSGPFGSLCDGKTPGHDDVGKSDICFAWATSVTDGAR